MVPPFDGLRAPRARRGAGFRGSALRRTQGAPSLPRGGVPGFVLSAALATCAGLFAQSPAPAPSPSATIDPALLSELTWRTIGPFRGGRTKAVAGIPSQPNVFYIGVVNGGVWKTTDCGPHVDADLRRPADGIDRRDRDRAVRSEHHLRRQRRRPAAPGSLDRRRHLQVDRRRPDLDAPRSARRPADSADRRRPAQSRTGCSSPCSVIRTGRTRSAASSDRPTAARRSSTCSTRTRTPAAWISRSIRCDANVVYAVLWEARQGPWENGAWTGPGQRTVQVDRRRHDLAAADARAADVRRGARPHRHHGRAERSQPALRRRGRRPRAAASIDRMTRARPGRASTPTRASSRGRRRRRRPRRSEEPRHRLRADASSRGSPPTAARRSPAGAARRAATTTRGSGSTRISPT